MQPEGYDIDTANLIARALGVKLVLVPVTSDNRIPFLQTNKVDLVISSLGTTPARAKVIDFSEDYAPFFSGVFGPPGIDVSKPADLAGKTIGVTRGAIEDLALTKVAPPDAIIHRYGDNRREHFRFPLRPDPVDRNGGLRCRGDHRTAPAPPTGAEIRAAGFALLCRHRQGKYRIAGQGERHHRASQKERRAQQDFDQMVGHASCRPGSDAASIRPGFRSTMSYHFDFGVLLNYAPMLAHGVLITTELTLFGGDWVCARGSLRLGADRRPGMAAPAGRRLCRGDPQHAFHHPALLPVLRPAVARDQLPAMQAAVLAMVINLGAYGTEIVRAGIEATPRGAIRSRPGLGMSGPEVFRHVVLLPALARIWPALSAQIVIVMLGSAVCSQIDVQELTYAAGFIQSRSFRAFEAYFGVTVIYLGLALLLRLALRMADATCFPDRTCDDLVHPLGHRPQFAAGDALDHPVIGRRVRRWRHCRSCCAARPRSAIRSGGQGGPALHRGVPGHAAVDAAFPGVLRRQPVRRRCRADHLGGHRADAEWRGVPRRDLARLHPGHSGTANGKPRPRWACGICSACAM